MQTKTKYTIAIVAILMLTVFVIGFLFKIKKADNASSIIQSNPNAQTKPKIQKEAPREFSTVFVEGEVISLKNNQLEIKNGELTNKLDTIENVLIYAKDGEEIIKKEIKDLTKSTKIKAEVDKANSKVIAVEIL